VAARIGGELRRAVEVVGVFVNATLDEVAATADTCSLTMLQLHGDEGPAYCQEAARRTGCKVMKAARVRDRASVRDLAPFHTDYHLLDAHAPDRFGGTGATFNWELARTHTSDVPFVLSGGLTPANVAEGIEAARPAGVDSASGTEALPGRKDPDKVRAFIREAADAGRRLERAA